MPGLRSYSRILIGLLLLGACVSGSAQTGSSIPSYEDGLLTVPRVDVEGYGSLQLQLSLQDESSLTFALHSAVTAAPSLTPGATYSLDSSILSIPLLQAGTEFYDLQLQLTPAELFQVVSADVTKLPGQEPVRELSWRKWPGRAGSRVPGQLRELR